MRFPRTFVLVALPLAALLAAGPASADGPKKGDDKDAPKGPHAELVKYRQLEMGALARHFGATKRILKNEVDRKEDLLGHTAALVDLSRDMVSQYPEGTGPDAYKTEALKKIWTDAEGFAKAVADFEAAAKELHAKAEARDMEGALAAFEKAGDTCGGCHDNYREDDH